MFTVCKLHASVEFKVRRLFPDQETWGTTHVTLPELEDVEFTILKAQVETGSVITSLKRLNGY